MLYDEPGRCGGMDSHSHHFRVVRDIGLDLLVRHGGGEERVRLSGPIEAGLQALDSDARYWLLCAIYHAHHDGERDATDRERDKWQRAAAEKRIKTRKCQKYVKVWIENSCPAQVGAL